MKTLQTITVQNQMGIDRSIPADISTAQQIENFKYDPQTKGWTNRFGYEPYFPNSTTNGPFSAANGLDAKIDSLYTFERHSGKQQFIMFECNGKLGYLKPYVADQHVILDDNRSIPNPGREKTSYEPFGRYVVITNGIDRPVKWRGTDQLFPLGWAESPGTPTVRACEQVPVDGVRTSFEATDDFVGSGDNIYKGTDAYFEGVSSETKDETVKYFYKVSYLNENGSESPLSIESNRFTYTSSEITRDGNTGVPKVCPIVEIPIGPEGTVARRLYRTKRNGDKSLYYLVETIKNNSAQLYVDYRSDSSLGPEAPSPLDSIPFPAPSCRFSASFKNCLFVDGGEMDPTRLYYSAPLELDRFRALDYFEVGTREGGEIVGLETFYNSLLVFRENGIDLIRGDSINGFELVPFVEGVGTFSNSTIVTMPKIGVAFLCVDGIYLIAGGMDGGADLSIQKISSELDELFDRMSIDLMTSAVGAYSQKEKELQFWLPMSGRPNLFRGVVFHINNAQWSERSYINLSCIAVDTDDNFLFGMDTYSGLVDGQEIKRGIYAQSNIHQNGVRYQLGSEDPVAGFAMMSEFRSQWTDFGSPVLKKFPKYLYITAITGGNQTIGVKTYKDRDWNDGYDAGVAKWQVADGPDQPTYDLSRWDAVNWQDKRLVTIRYPIIGGAYTEMAFKIVTDQPFTFVGYSIEFQVDGTKVIGGKI
jgi:hypothetical protein